VSDHYPIELLIQSSQQPSRPVRQVFDTYNFVNKQFCKYMWSVALSRFGRWNIMMLRYITIWCEKNVFNLTNSHLLRKHACISLLTISDCTWLWKSKLDDNFACTHIVHAAQNCCMLLYQHTSFKICGRVSRVLTTAKYHCVTCHSEFVVQPCCIRLVVMSCMRVCRKQALSRVKYYYYTTISKIQQQQ